MDLIEWLKGLFKPPTLDQKVNAAYDPHLLKPKTSNTNTAAQHGIPSWMDSLFRSPLADSLYKVSGGVPHILGSMEPQSGYGQVFGEYYPSTDVLYMNKDKTKYDTVGTEVGRGESVRDPRSVFIHEMGHKYKSYGGPAYQPTNVLPFPESFYLRDTPAGKASLDLNTYYSKNSMEGVAQAFLNAWNYLDKTKDPKVDYRKLAGEMEGNTPGMGQIIENLLQTDLFQNHPLRGKAFTKAKEQK